MYQELIFMDRSMKKALKKTVIFETVLTSMREAACLLDGVGNELEDLLYGLKKKNSFKEEDAISSTAGKDLEDSE